MRKVNRHREEPRSWSFWAGPEELWDLMGVKVDAARGVVDRRRDRARRS